jgi:hypothetical protein
LNVNITNNILAVAPLWNIAIQVPVISQDTEIKLDILSQASDYGLKDTGYIVDSYSCTDGLKGYYIISENLKDTLIAYNLPDVYEVPSVFYDIERPEYSYRYEYKIEFVYTIAKEEDIPVCLALYPVKYPYAKQITVKSASKIADTVLPSCDIKTRFLEEVEYEVTILKTAPQKDFYSPSLCIIRGESGATLYVNEHMPVIGVICNFPQYALDWDIPEEGLPVIIKGKTYDYDKFYPADRVMYYLELSTIKKKEL